jgi:hypothetical protein
MTAAQHFLPVPGSQRSPRTLLLRLTAFALLWAGLSACGDSGGSGTTPPVTTGACGSGAVLSFLLPDQVSASASNQFFILSGVALGELQDMKVFRERPEGELAVASVDEAPFFALDPVALEDGWNRFLLRGTASDGRILEDRVTVIYNPDGTVPAGTVRPDFVEVDVPVSLFFEIDTDRIPLIENGVELWAADPNGTPRSFLGTMRDDGGVQSDGEDSTSGDALAGDLVFSARLDTSFDSPGPRSFVFVLYGKNQGMNVERYSTRLDLDVVAPVVEANCQDHRETLQALRARFDELQIDQSFDEARGQVIAEALEETGVANAGGSTCSSTIWLRFDDGLLGVIPLATWRGADELAALDVAPYAATTWARDWSIEDRNALLVGDATGVTGSVSPDSCPSLLAKPIATEGTTLPYEWISEAGSGLLFLAADGALAFSDMPPELATGYDFSPGEPELLPLFIHDDICHHLGDAIDPDAEGEDGEPLTIREECSYDPKIPNRSKRCVRYGKECALQTTKSDGTHWGICQDRRSLDLRAGRLILTPDGFALSSAFVDRYLDDVDGGVALLDVPRSGYNGRLATAFLKKGYKLVTTRRARDTSEAFAPFVDALLSQTAWDEASHPALRFFGANRVGFSSYGMTNGTFERPDLDGWRRGGDARRVSEYPGSEIVEGKGMAVLSTGMGFAEQGGSIEQVFCPAPGTDTLRFYWRVYSEEFQEWCGDVDHDDEFFVTVSVGGQSTRILDATISQLCPPDQDAGYCGVCVDPDTSNCPCGGLFGEGLSLVEDLHFDIDDGDVWQTAWRELSFPLPFAGIRPVHLRFEVRDRGDSLSDTAVLLDRIEVN